MAKGLRNYSEEKREQVIASRLASKTGGLGYLAAQDAEYRIMIEKARKQVVKKEAEAKA